MRGMIVVYFRWRARNGAPSSCPAQARDCYLCPADRCRIYADRWARAEFDSVDTFKKWVNEWAHDYANGKKNACKSTLEIKHIICNGEVLIWQLPE